MEVWVFCYIKLIVDFVNVIGIFILFVYIGNCNIMEMLCGMVIGVGVVWLIFILVFWLFFLSLIGIIVNFVFCLVILGIWVLINGEVGMVVVIVVLVIFGIVVDVIIYMLIVYF